VQIVDVHTAFRGGEAELVGRAPGHASLDAPPAKKTLKP